MYVLHTCPSCPYQLIKTFHIRNKSNNSKDRYTSKIYRVFSSNLNYIYFFFSKQRQHRQQLLLIDRHEYITSKMGDLYHRAISLASTPASKWPSLALLTADAFLCVLIIWKIPCKTCPFPHLLSLLTPSLYLFEQKKNLFFFPL